MPAGRREVLAPALAADLVGHQVTIIAASGTSAPGLAAKAATSGTPIAFQTGGDPVQDGLLTSIQGWKAAWSA
jgi:hypothetical protein